ncbi:MAG: hypothetical protein V1781_09550 [Bacteroidota bacterium]
MLLFWYKSIISLVRHGGLDPPSIKNYNFFYKSFLMYRNGYGVLCWIPLLQNNETMKQ